MIRIKFIQFKDAETLYTFYEESSTYTEGTIKMNMRIADWPFKSLSNVLNIEMENIAQSSVTAPCGVDVDNSVDNAGYLQWIKINLYGVAAYLYNYLLFIIFCFFLIYI